MANDLKRQLDEQTKLYKKLQEETRSLISAHTEQVKHLKEQNKTFRARAVQFKNSIVEELKTAQLKQQENAMLKASLDVANRNKYIAQRDLEIKTRLFDQNREELQRLSALRKASGGALPKLTDEARLIQLKNQILGQKQSVTAAQKQYTQANKNQQQVSQQLAATSAPSRLGTLGNIAKMAIGKATRAAGNIAKMAGGATLASRPNPPTTKPSAAAALAIGLGKAASAAIDFVNSIKKTQQDFGLSMTQAAELQARMLKDSFVGMKETFESLDFTGLGDLIGDTFSTLFNAGRGLTSAAFGQGSVGDVFSGAMTEFKGLAERLTADRGPLVEKARIYVGKKTREDALKSVQDEFGVLDEGAMKGVANLAAERGLSTDAIVKARRVFATQALGDLNKAGVLQNKFLTQFSKAGMTPKVAMEAIGKYSELMARNGSRFADSFARAAADAKRMGVDLNKVSQFGDSIIDNYEGFLEGSAELGAMGMNIDANRLMEVSVTGSDADLYNELNKQLQTLGKDITNLDRPTRIALERFMGMSISELQKLAAPKPTKSPELTEAEKGNSLLDSLLKAMGPTGDLMNFLKGPGGTIALIAAITTGFGALSELILRIAAEIPRIGKKIKAENQARQLFSQNKGYEARDVLRQAGVDKTVIEKLTQTWLSENNSKVQEQIKAGKVQGARYSAETNTNVFTESDVGYAKDKENKAVQMGTLPTMRAAQISQENIRKAQEDAITASNIQYLNKTYGNILPGTYRGNLFQPVQPSTQIPTIKPKVSATGFAEGGKVTGPGTPTSDSIPAMLSNGEYVVNAKAVSSIGVDKLDSLNKTGSAVLDSASTVGSIAAVLKDITRYAQTLDKVEGVTGKLKNFALIQQILKGQWKAIAETVGMDGAESLISRAVNVAGAEAFIIGLGLSDTYDTYKEQSQMSWNKGKNPLFYTGYDVGKAEPEWVKNSRERGKAMPRKQPSEWSKNFAAGVGVKMRDGGLVGSLKSNLMSKGMGLAGSRVPGFAKYMPQATSLYGTYKQGGTGGLKSSLMNTGMGLASTNVPGFAKYMPQASNLYDTYKQGGIGGLKSNALNTGLGLLGNRFSSLSGSIGAFKQGGVGGLKSSLLNTGLGFLGGKVPGLSGAMGAFKEGGVGGVKSSLLTQGLGMIGKKVPGLSGAMNAFSAFKQGGVKGALGSLAKGGIGKALGGAIGTAIPIPGVGTAIGSLVGSKLGKLAGGLFGKKKPQATPSGPGISSPSVDLGTMAGGQQQQQEPRETEQKPVTVDTSGMEQKLNNFITALQGIQIHMDGAKVGKVLVNASDSAVVSGLYRAQSQ